MIFSRNIRLLIPLLLVLVCQAAQGKERSDNLKPRWMTSALPSPKSPGYIFMSAQGSGMTLEEARQRALVNLTSKLEHERGIEIDSNLSVSSTSTRRGGARSSSTSRTFELQCRERGKEIVLVTRVVDEYWERDDRGLYTLTELFTVNDRNVQASGSYADNIRLTTSYGALPMVYSLIPGAGQFYKGNNLKGGVILGGAVACTAAIVTTHSLYSSYANKRVEYPRHFDFYNKKATDCRNARNVVIGVGAALYLYNLLDAAIAPGRRRVKVSKDRGVSYSLAPALSTVPGSESGLAPAVALSINF